MQDLTLHPWTKQKLSQSTGYIPYCWAAEQEHLRSRYISANSWFKFWHCFFVSRSNHDNLDKIAVVFHSKTLKLLIGSEYRRLRSEHGERFCWLWKLNIKTFVRYPIFLKEKHACFESNAKVFWKKNDYMLRPILAWIFFQEFSNFSTLEYDIPNLWKKRSVQCTGSNFNPTPKNFKIGKKD